MIIEEETIWFPGPYKGRPDGGFEKLVSDSSLPEIIEFVQTRAKEDGKWTIENNLVGDNEDRMRRMMAWVSRETNIKQCVEHIRAAEEDEIRTVDWVCRELANASKMSVGGGTR